MGTYRPDLDHTSSLPDSVVAIAEQLRAPLSELAVLEREAAGVAARAAAAPPAERLEDLERLVRLSLSAMQHFHELTRELNRAIRDLTDAGIDAH